MPAAGAAASIQQVPTCSGMGITTESSPHRPLRKLRHRPEVPQSQVAGVGSEPESPQATYLTQTPHCSQALQMAQGATHPCCPESACQLQAHHSPGGFIHPTAQTRPHSPWGLGQATEQPRLRRPLGGRAQHPSVWMRLTMATDTAPSSLTIPFSPPPHSIPAGTLKHQCDPTALTEEKMEPGPPDSAVPRAPNLQSDGDRNLGQHRPSWSLPGLGVPMWTPSREHHRPGLLAAFRCKAASRKGGHRGQEGSPPRCLLHWPHLI